ncbi:MAG: FHA domain-containing protein [Candidatus Methylacidiphilales bacterium]|nr:FHA domain-containing protein [Candidatus Methylacidiphilales bacterium]
MSTSACQIFHIKDVLERLHQYRATGWLHIFCATGSADLYVDETLIVAASSGTHRDMDAVHDALSFADPNWIWKPGVKHPQPMMATPIQGLLLELSIANDHQHVVSTGMDGTARIPKLDHLKDSRNLAGLPKWQLVFVDSGETVQIPPEGAILGRQADCQITIFHTSISRRHCQIRITPRGLLLTDLGSTNGTFVKHHRITEGIIGEDEEFVLGEVFFRAYKMQARSGTVPPVLPSSVSAQQASTVDLTPPPVKKSDARSAAPVPKPAPQLGRIPSALGPSGEKVTTGSLKKRW